MKLLPFLLFLSLLSCSTLKERFIECTNKCERQGFIDLEQCRWKQGEVFYRCYSKQLLDEQRCCERNCYPIIYKE